MKVWIKGSATPIDLSQRDFVGGGGEGNVYVKGQVAHKVFHDPARMLPTNKFQELSAIADPDVIRPRDILVDDKGRDVGYTMRFIRDAMPLCQMFPRAFREREGIKPGQVLDLVRKMQAGIQGVHKAGILIVDCNEMNFLVGHDLKDLFFIDVDSWQTRSHPATAIMDSIRDWTVKGNAWTDMSDWWSFGILSFQMFVGLHPFRGKYHGQDAKYKIKLPGDDPNDSFAVTRRRMQAGISVLHPDVGVPGSAYPLSVMPPEWLRWYEAMWVKGQRLPPPDKAGVIVVVPVTTTMGTGTAIEATLCWTLPSDITNLWGSALPGGIPCITTATTVQLGQVAVPVPGGPVTVCGQSSKAVRTIVGSLAGGRLSLWNLTDRAPVVFDLAVLEASCTDGRIHVRTADHIHEVQLTDVGANVLASTRPVANVMPHATRLFDGVALQNMLGTTWASLFTGPGQARQVRLPDLDGMRVATATHDRGVLMVLAERGGRWSRLVYRFDGDEHDIRIIPDANPGDGLEFVVLDSGTVVSRIDEDTLELFSRRKGSATVKTVQDPTLPGMRLIRLDGGLAAIKGGQVHKLKLRPVA